jgi:Zn-dependent peptidase ImmA (M78 family)
MSRIAVNPDLLRWARDRAGKDVEELRSKFPKIDEWETEETSPTVKQLEKYAKATYTPFGYFFLAEPPDEDLHVPYFRTMATKAATTRPTPNLLDTVQTIQRRQAWLRETLVAEREAPLAYVGSTDMREAPSVVAARIREELGLADGWARQQPTWTAALQALREAMDTAGIVVATNGVVGNNTHRKLDPDEFRGFVLVDEYAPFVFVNGSDAKAAQMFTLAHELAHLWFGQSAIFDLRRLQPASAAIEIACNAVAAEFLVPERELLEEWGKAGADEPFKNLARHFKVSAIVVARRALDLELITRTAFFAFYAAHQSEFQEEIRRRKEEEGGGNFYATQNIRLGKRFAFAVFHAVGEGRLAYREAYALTGLWGQTFDKYAIELKGKPSRQ